MADWTVGGTTLSGREQPLATSDFPAAQEDRHIFHEPIGGDAADSTVLTYVGTPSMRARLDFLCNSTTRDVLIALKRTTFTVTDSYANSTSWYLERLAIKTTPWNSSRFQIQAFLVGR